jgi:hypothetical protein
MDTPEGKCYRLSVYNLWITLSGMFGATTPGKIGCRKADAAALAGEAALKGLQYFP